MCVWETTYDVTFNRFQLAKPSENPAVNMRSWRVWHSLCERACVCMHIFSLQSVVWEDTPSFPSVLRTRPPLDIKDAFVLNLVPSLFSPLFWKPTVNIRCESAYFQIPSIPAWQTKGGLYCRFGGRKKDANRACQCIAWLCEAANNSCSVKLCGDWSVWCCAVWDGRRRQN